MKLKHYFKAIMCIFFILPLYGCNNLGKQVEVRIEPGFYADPWTGEVRDRSHIIVTSLADQPIEIRTIAINRGACNSDVVQGSGQLSHYGSFVKIVLKDCDMTMVKEVKLTMQGKSYTYYF